MIIIKRQKSDAQLLGLIDDGAAADFSFGRDFSIGADDRSSLDNSVIANSSTCFNDTAWLNHNMGANYSTILNHYAIFNGGVIANIADAYGTMGSNGRIIADDGLGQIHATDILQFWYQALEFYGSGELWISVATLKM